MPFFRRLPLPGLAGAIAGPAAIPSRFPSHVPEGFISAACFHMASGLAIHIITEGF